MNKKYNINLLKIFKNLKSSLLQFFYSLNLSIFTSLRFFPLFLGLGTCNLGFGTSKVDSLKTIIKTTKGDTTKIKALNALAWELKEEVPSPKFKIQKNKKR